MSAISLWPTAEERNAGGRKGTLCSRRALATRSGSARAGPGCGKDSGKGGL